MSTAPDRTPDPPEPPSRTTILATALGGVAAFAVIVLVLFRVMGGVNQAVNNAADEQRQRDEQNQRQLDRLFGGKQLVADPTKERAFVDITHPDAEIRLESATVISKLYMTDSRAITALLARLKDDTDTRVRLSALRVLASVQPRSPTVADALRSATKDNDPRVCAEAEAALAKD